MHIGTEVPIAVSKQTKEGEKTTDWQYRNVGTNIRCDAQSLDEGRYRVTLQFEQSSLHSGSKEGAQPVDAPLFNTWSQNAGDIYRDGQTIQSALGNRSKHW
jgi:type II secretory pathway component GspD/PulD (secretin)